MHNWYWKSWEGITYLRCDLLDHWSHGFFTQEAWPRTPQELVMALVADSSSPTPTATQVYRIKQVHGNTVLTASESQQPVENSEASEQSEGQKIELALADGLISDAAGQAVWVCSADCTPALIGDVVTGQVAAVHAGWRGTAAKIIPVAIAKFLAQGSHLSNLRVAMGPAISGTVYQVSAEVAAQTAATVAPNPAVGIDSLLADLQALPQPPIIPDAKLGHVKLDVRRVNALQLEHLGLQPEQIAIAPHCTFQEPERFFSYRRTGLKQVQWSGLISHGGDTVSG